MDLVSDRGGGGGSGDSHAVFPSSLSCGKIRLKTKPLLLINFQNYKAAQLVFLKNFLGISQNETSSRGYMVKSNQKKNILYKVT